MVETCLESFGINKRLHYLGATNCHVIRYGNLNLNGSSSSQFANIAALAAIGEYIERKYLTQFVNDAVNRKKAIQGVSLLTGRIFNSNNNAQIINNYFYDSSACASYTNTKIAIGNAFAEFIERQSFILSYLSKQKGRVLSEECTREYTSESRYRDSITFYDISIIPEYFVIFGYGLYEGNAYVGLGSSSDFAEAIKKCVKELNQVDNFQFNNDISENLNYTKDTGRDYFDVYIKLNPIEVVKSYDYLAHSSEQLKLPTGKNADLKLIVEKLNNIYKMDPYVFYVGDDDCVGKVVKIIDFNWFPNLLPLTYDESVYNRIEKITGYSLDRKCNFIPFP